MRNWKTASSRRGRRLLQNNRLLVEPLEPRVMLDAGPLFISEFMAVNNNTLVDSDGNFSDWIEIHNPTNLEINLEGWSLTDDANDLAEWRFPAVTLGPREDVVVFASGKDRTDPAAELHASFKLSGGGEYLGLIRPDGVTVSHAYAPEYPAQSSDVSYGLTERTTTLLQEGADVDFLVPSIEDADAGTDWTTLDLQYDRWTGAARPPAVLVTEVGTRTPDWLEIQNLAGEPVDTAGWKVVANNAGRSGGINVFHETLWELPDVMEADEVLYRNDNESDPEHYWEENIQWSTKGDGWVAILDADGNVADFVIWGYDDAAFATFDVTVEGVRLTAEGIWSGPAVEANPDSSTRLQRHGAADHDDATNWAWVEPDSQGEQNVDLVTPFPATPTTGVGFSAEEGGFLGSIQTDIGSKMQNINSSIWTRVPFTVSDPSVFDSLALRIKYNDGFVAYLNGQEIARRNAPDTLTWDASATAARDVAQSSVYESIDVSEFLGELFPGPNMLAVHGLNVMASDDDFLLSPKLVGGGSRGNERFFADPTPGTPNPTGSVAINEIHCNPAEDAKLIEFIELLNSLDVPMDLSGWYFDDGINYTFPQGSILGAGEYLVLAQNADAFTAEFGMAPFGQFTGKLSAEGERLVLRDAKRHLRDQVDYGLGYPWPTVGDAPGNSMELLDPALDNDLGGSWRSSVGSEKVSGATPGQRNSVFSAFAPPQTRQARHEPHQPRSGEDVTITVKATDPDGVAAVTLDYQVVEPGDYISIRDDRYQTEWTTLVMTDDGTGGDATANDDTYSVVLPGTLNQHRGLVRYRITTEDSSGMSITVPYADDAQPNFTYFVYDGIPEWTAADRPGATLPETFDEETMRALPAMHLITTESDVIACQYITSNNTKAFQFEGALVVGDEVYDHIHYRIRGAGSTYVAGKNKWKFRFNRGHYYEGHDQYGNEWPEKVRTLNLGSTASPWASPNRGLSGLDEAVAFRLFNMAGVAAPHLSPKQLRIIDAVDEVDPNNQYNGDVWGLYVAFENPGGRFLDSHDLPDGNLYRYDWSAELENQGPGLPAGDAFPNAFVADYNRAQPVSWWRANVDVAGYYSLRSIAEVLNHTDMTEKHNMLLYYNPETDKWSQLPWDLDLLYEEFDRWGPDGVQSHLPYEQFRKMLVHEELNVEFQARARELQDLLLNQDQLWQLIEEYARYVEPLVRVDQFRWNYDPRAQSGPARGWHYGAYFQETASYYGGASGQTRRAISPVGFEGMINWVKEFTTLGGFGGDQLAVLHDDPAIPETPTLTSTSAPTFPLNNLSFHTSDFADPQGSASFAAQEWRIGEVTDPTSVLYDPTASVKYEIDTIWESGEIETFQSNVTLPGGSLEVGHTYRARVRVQDDTGRWSHWSEPVQFIAGVPDGPVVPQLQITEIMAHPAEPTPEELAVDPGLTADDFEYIELQNTGIEPLDLTGVQFVDGIRFDFASGDVTELASGAFVVVVKNPTAFALRHGSEIDGHVINVAGTFSLRLDDDGERITLVDNLGTVLLNFSYSTSGQWPNESAGRGASLELVDPGSVPPVDPERTNYLEDGANWRRSVRYGGTPGASGDDELGIIVNEVLSRSDPPLVDAIELHNMSGASIDIGGWYVSDSWGWTFSGRNGDYQKFQIPQGTTIPAGGYLVLDESDFNTSAGADPANHPNDFALDGVQGDDVWLMAAGPSGQLTHFADRIAFDAAENNESFGRWFDDQGDEHFYPMADITLGGENSGPRVGPLVISELMYHPPNLDGPGGIDPDDLEFLEIHNPTNQAVSLEGWRIRGGIAFNFAEDTILQAGNVLVVLPFNPHDPLEAERWATFRASYQLEDDTTGFVGGYADRLNNGGERVRLERADAPSPLRPNVIPNVIEDEVDFGDQAPWPMSPDGLGDSLTRVSANAWGHDADSWLATVPTPGQVDLAVSETEIIGRYVFYNNSAFDGNGAAGGAEDDNAVDPDRRALLPGQTASAANYTNYTRGLNGIMIDVAGLASGGALDPAADLQFRMGNDDDPSAWAIAPLPASISVRAGEGRDGSDRISLTWAEDQAIKGQWLQITVRSTPNTGLTTDDVFYFGNAVGEAGNSTTDAMVTAADEFLARDGRRGLADPVEVDNPLDFNRDRLVNIADRLVARNNRTGLGDSLRLITPPAPGGLSIQSSADIVYRLTGESPDLGWLQDLALEPPEEAETRLREDIIDQLLRTFGDK